MAAIQAVDVADVADPLDVGILCAVFFGSQPEHFRVGDVPFHVFQEFFVVVFALLKGFFDDGGALCFAVNGKIFIIAQTVGEHAQNTHAHAVNCADPHAFGVVDHQRQSLLHLLGGLVRKSDRQNGGRIYPLFLYDVGDARSEDARFAAARARKHQYGAFGIQNGFELIGIESLQNFVHIVSTVKYFPRYYIIFAAKTQYKTICFSTQTRIPF